MKTEMQEREVISPEGIEERVVHEEAYRITLTGGGKYRVYHQGGDGKWHSMRSHDSKDEAIKDMGTGMLITGGLHADPKKTLDLLLGSFEKGKP